MIQEQSSVVAILGDTSPVRYGRGAIGKSSQSSLFRVCGRRDA